jgi:hypothetical protein
MTDRTTLFGCACYSVFKELLAVSGFSFAGHFIASRLLIYDLKFRCQEKI